MGGIAFSFADDFPQCTPVKLTEEEVINHYIGESQKQLWALLNQPTIHQGINVSIVELEKEKKTGVISSKLNNSGTANRVILNGGLVSYSDFNWSHGSFAAWNFQNKVVSHEEKNINRWIEDSKTLGRLLGAPTRDNFDFVVEAIRDGVGALLGYRISMNLKNNALDKTLKNYVDFLARSKEVVVDPCAHELRAKIKTFDTSTAGIVKVQNMVMEIEYQYLNGIEYVRSQRVWTHLSVFGSGSDWQLDETFSKPEYDRQ